jgi:predicted amidohydrolase YtcJ
MEIMPNHFTRLCAILLLFVVIIAGFSPAQETARPAEMADLVLLNGKVWTGGENQPAAMALAARQGRLVHVGNDADARKFVGPNTRVIDAQGKRVVPGFHDSHVHILGAGLGLSRVQLKNATNEADFGSRLQEFDRKLPKDRWLLGGDWDHDRTFGGTLPTAALVDKYVKERPVFLRRYDGHMALANTMALKLAGINANTADPPGGEIVRLPGGKQPSGILRDTAMGLITGKNLIPATSGGEILEAVKVALREAREVGVTSVEDMDGSDAATRHLLMRVYADMANRGDLTFRVRLYTPIAEWNTFPPLHVRANEQSVWVRGNAVKGYIDGSLGSSTAKMYQPYVHEPMNSGVFVTSPLRLRQLVRDADEHGLDIAIHAIGDEGNGELLKIYAGMPPLKYGRRRFRVEHAQILRPDQYKLFRDSDVIASMQPYHIIDDGRWAEGRIGTERCRSSYACRSLLDAQVMLAFGSDWPVAPLSPLLGIDAAVNRRTLDGKHPNGWFPEQKITVAEALRAYTYGSAFASRQEYIKGTLSVGKLADFVILSRDILDEKEKDRIAETQVLRTVAGGKEVFERK